MGGDHILHIFGHIGYIEKGGSIAKWRGLLQNGLYHTGHISHILYIIFDIFPIFGISLR